MTDALHFRTLASLAQGIEDGEFSSVDVTRCFIDRIESMNGELNAFRMPTPDRALDAARAADRLLASGQRLGPLHGVPYAAKDLYDVQGLPTSAGARVLEDNIATADSHTVASLARAGIRAKTASRRL